jgi:hypothetical protein
MKTSLPLNFFPLSTTNDYALLSDKPTTMSSFYSNIETSTVDDCFALQVNHEIIVKDSLAVVLVPSVGVSAPSTQGVVSPGTESLCFRVDKAVHFQGIGLPHHLFSNGEQTGIACFSTEFQV